MIGAITSDRSKERDRPPYTEYNSVNSDRNATPTYLYSTTTVSVRTYNGTSTHDGCHGPISEISNNNKMKRRMEFVRF
jgi:hypothetical protein